ncbi:MAG: V-type sodium ATP synthase, subunit J [uncultured bacterium]|nr:MAG: V-type sodium ATP synthase, subunit J [uncultured bacterium]
MKKNKSNKNILLDLKNDNWFASITKYPERILPVTFFLLCLLGSILLALPFATTKGISFLDAIFTSVSAVCVTGLVVLDTGKDFTNLGQFIILLLIQAGGLGIMSFTSIIFILLGKRMSLSQEKTVRSIFDVESQEEIRKSLKLIFKFTFIAEFIGAFILVICFMQTENSFLYALKQGIFTSVSAFCNAGFFLKASSLMDYQSNPIILYTVSLLFILGGISPAISVLLPNIFKRKKLHPMAVLVLTTTLALLVFGTIFFYISEYNGVLSGMSIADKFNNAWFQSATPRTAGFNSIDFGEINVGTFLFIVFLMIIGGSPGGTAGGIKTGAIGILFLTFYNTIMGKSNIIYNRQITLVIIQKALSLALVYLLILFTVILTLFTTQSIPPTQLIFEATSALGTVGLSMGATSNLDEVGKVIVIITMFLGRVGPATFLFYINAKNTDSKISYPDAKISLA